MSFSTSEVDAVDLEVSPLCTARNRMHTLIKQKEKK